MQACGLGALLPKKWNVSLNRGSAMVSFSRRSRESAGMAERGAPVLLTGGAGFIGSHLAEGLVRTGVELSIVDNLNEFYSSQWKHGNLADIRTLGDFRFFDIDICDVQAMRKAFQHVRPKCVIHLAACA